MAQRYNILVGAIPVRDQKILLLQRSETEKFMPGAWGLPSGKIDFGEDLREAVLRELSEEAGLAGTVQRLCGYSTFFSTKDGDDLHNLQINFLVAAALGPVTLDHSNQAFRWISPNEVRDSELDDFTKNTIQQYLNSWGRDDVG